MSSKREKIHEFWMKRTGREYVQEPDIRYLLRATDNEIYKYCLDLHRIHNAGEFRYLSIDLEDKLYEINDEDINYGLALVGSERIIEKVVKQRGLDPVVRQGLLNAVSRNQHWFHLRDKPLADSWINTLVQDMVQSRDIIWLEAFVINPHLDQEFIVSLLHRAGPFDGIDDDTFLKVTSNALWDNETYTGRIFKNEPSQYPDLAFFKVWKVLLDAPVDRNFAIWLTRYLSNIGDNLDVLSLPDKFAPLKLELADTPGQLFKNEPKFHASLILKKKYFLEHLINKFQTVDGDLRGVYGELRKAIVASVSSEDLAQLEKPLLKKNDSYVTQGYFQGLYSKSCQITKRQFKRNLRRYKRDFILGFLATEPLFEHWQRARIIRSWVYQASMKLKLWGAYYDRCDEVEKCNKVGRFDASSNDPQLTGLEKWRDFEDKFPWLSFALFVAAVFVMRQLVIWIHEGLH